MCEDFAGEIKRFLSCAISKAETKNCRATVIDEEDVAVIKPELQQRKIRIGTMSLSDGKCYD